MILKILIINMFVIAVFMYLIILGASKNKTAEEIEQEEKNEEVKETKKKIRKTKEEEK